MKVIVAGDYCDRFRINEKIKEGEYALIFEEVKPIIESSDVSIVNFEFPVVLNEGKPIPKCGPNLRGQKESIDAIKYAGFNVCTLANNHILDQGEACCLETKSLLESSGVKTVGAGKNLNEAGEILYIENDCEKLAIINCCEHEFSIATETMAGANPLNLIQQYYKICEARRKADYVLVIVHGGHEHYQLPSPRMKETYRFFIEAGADAVVNHHQHCYSGFEIYNDKPIFYGLGNFCFDDEVKRNSIWNEGFMLSLLFNRDKNPIYEMHPYIQCNEHPKVSMMNEKQKEDFNIHINVLNGIISDNITLKSSYDLHIQKQSWLFRLLLSPWRGRISRALFLRNLLPICKTKQDLLLFQNFIMCESHRDCFIGMLKEQTM